LPAGSHEEGERDADGHYAYQACEADGTLDHFFLAPGLTPLLSQASGYQGLSSFGDPGTGAPQVDHEVCSSTPIVLRGDVAMPAPLPSSHRDRRQ
jgi:hypothetical protein